jgi:hypothetical protein
MASTGLAAAIAATSVAFAAGGEASKASSTTGSSRAIVTHERMAIDSAAVLAEYSDYIAAGTFVRIAGTGVASDYGLGTPLNPNDPVVNLWEFHIDRVFKGTGPTNVLVVRYNQDQIESDETPLAPGTSAVAFLSADFNGARVVIGGDQGVLRRSGSDELAPISDEVNVLTGASSEDVLAAAVK